MLQAVQRACQARQANSGMKMSQLGICMLQIASVRKAFGAGRARKLAALIRSATFMQRYRSDLETRDARLQELAEDWCGQSSQDSDTVSNHVYITSIVFQSFVAIVRSLSR